MMQAPVLLVTHEPLETRLAGPAIRAWHLAYELAKVRPVRLAAPSVKDMVAQDPAVTLSAYNRATGQPLGEWAGEAAVVIASGFLLRRYPALAQAGKPLVVDLYDPFVLENLEIHAAKTLPEQTAIHRGNLQVLAEQLELGDFFICASQTQRDFWLGMLMSQGRINPYTLADDATLRRLIDVVPFGLPAGEPAGDQNAPVLKGAIPGIHPTDKVIYWGGGIWDWFDPLTLIEAVARVAEKRNDVRLFFAGVRHPSPDVPPMRMCRAAFEFSDRLGLTGKVVFFNDWVPYEERGRYLMEADIGASLHLAHVETRFSFRTRLLDYLWAGLPMVVTGGDTIGGWVEQFGLGRVVPPGDVEAVASALLDLLEGPGVRDEMAPRFDRVRQGLHWNEVVQPLAEYCRDPYRSADREALPVPSIQPASLWKRSWQVLRDRGPAALVQEIRSYIRWRLGSK